LPDHDATRSRPDSIDLNADLGEGFGRWRLDDDETVLDLVSSANIACGFHAGDPETMLRLCRSAVAAGVRIGAHLGHRDLFGFGRRDLAVEPATLRAETLYQIGALQAAARAAEGAVAHVKPHGALYHAASRDQATAETLATAVAQADKSLCLIGPPESRLSDAAEASGIAFQAEGFADRRYHPDGSLVPRSNGGLITDPHEVVRQGLALAFGEPVPVGAVRGPVLQVQTLCLHGDNPSVGAAARALAAALSEHSVAVRACAA
jgi:UPF0271 protein